MLKAEGFPCDCYEKFLQTSHPMLRWERSRIAAEKYFAVRQKHNAVTDSFYLVHVMGCPEDSGPSSDHKFSYSFTDQLRDRRVQRCGRFVKKKQPGFIQYCLGKVQAAYFTGREKSCLGMSELSKSNSCKRRLILSLRFFISYNKPKTYRFCKTVN
jgi:hypothetical protein